MNEKPRPGRPMVPPGSIKYHRGIKRKPVTRVGKLIELLASTDAAPSACGHNGPAYALVAIRPLYFGGERPTGAPDHCTSVCAQCAAEVLGLLRELAQPV